MTHESTTACLVKHGSAEGHRGFPRGGGGEGGAVLVSSGWGRPRGTEVHLRCGWGGAGEVGEGGTTERGVGEGDGGTGGLFGSVQVCCGLFSFCRQRGSRGTEVVPCVTRPLPTRLTSSSLFWRVPTASGAKPTRPVRVVWQGSLRETPRLAIFRC